MKQVFSRNGVVLPMDEAVVPLQSVEYAYGFGVYETVRATKGVAYFLGEHIDRLLASAHMLELEHTFAATQIRAFVADLLVAADIDTCNLKMLLIGAPDAAAATLYMIPLAPLFPDRKLYRDGATVTVVEQERFMPHVKSLNMLPSYLSYRKARQLGCYDALLVDRNQNILEGTRTNFFAIQGKELVSPPIERILEGITRDAVLLVARKHGYTVREQDIPLWSLSDYDGAFLTSTSSKVMPIGKVDERILSISPELRQLMLHFDTFMHTCGGKLKY